MHCREEADLPKLIVIDELRAICGSTASGFGGNGVAHARMGNGAFVPNESRRDNENKIAKALAHTKDAIEYIRCVHVNRRRARAISLEYELTFSSILQAAMGQ